MHRAIRRQRRRLWGCAGDLDLSGLAAEMFGDSLTINAVLGVGIAGDYLPGSQSNPVAVHIGKDGKVYRAISG